MHVSPQYRRKLHLRQSQIHFFLGEGRASGFPAKIARMAVVKRSPVSPGFRVPTFKPWLRHCPQTSQLDLRGHFCLLRGWWGEEEKRKRRGEKGREKTIEFHHLLLSII